VLGFGGLRLAVFAAAMLREGSDASPLVEPALIVVALAALLTPQALDWLKRARSTDAPAR